jgi:hypothetical protein
VHCSWGGTPEATIWGSNVTDLVGPRILKPETISLTIENKHLIPYGMTTLNCERAKDDKTIRPGDDEVDTGILNAAIGLGLKEGLDPIAAEGMSGKCAASMEVATCSGLQRLEQVAAEGGVASPAAAAEVVACLGLQKPEQVAAGQELGMPVSSLEVAAGPDLQGSREADTEREGAGKDIGLGTQEPKQRNRGKRRREKRQRLRMEKAVSSLSLEDKRSLPESGNADGHDRESGSGTPCGSAMTDKRKRQSAGNTPTSAQPAPKVSKTDGGNWAQTASKALVVYVAPELGGAPISPSELGHIKRVLIRKMLNDIVSIHVLSTTLQLGRVKITCEDETSLKWIKTQASALRPSEGSSRQRFCVIGPGDIPPTHKATVFVQSEVAESKEDFLRLLRLQNGAAVTDRIHLLGTAPRSVAGRIFAMGVEHSLFLEMRGRGDVALNLRLGLGRVALRLSKPGGRPSTDPGGSGTTVPEVRAVGGSRVA